MHMADWVTDFGKMEVTDHDEAERTCFTCANAFVDDNDCIICILDGRSRDDDQTCDEWN